LITTDGFAEIGDFVLGTDGSGYDNLIVKTGASRYKEKTGLSTIDVEGHNKFDDFLYMNGGGIFNFTLEVVPQLIIQILSKNGLEQDDINYYIFHQANKFMLNTIRKVCLLPKDKFYTNLEETGNTVSSTILIGLKDCMTSGAVKNSMKVMITGFGVGLSWGGTVLTL
jgi:3-oxoacyl-[acyl-carrier-protein] synthase-3